MSNQNPYRGSQGGSPYQSGPPSGSDGASQRSTSRPISSYSDDLRARFSRLPDQSQQVRRDIYGRPLSNDPSSDHPAQERPYPYHQYDDGSDRSRNPQDLPYNSYSPRPQGTTYNSGNANTVTPLGPPPPYSQFDPHFTETVPACECGVESCNFPQTRAAMVTGNPGGLALFDKLMTCHLKNAESKKTQERLVRSYIARHPAPSAS